MGKPEDTQPDFEKALAELEQLVSRLESGQRSLDESLDDFKRGVELTRLCQSTLDNAQQTVEKLLDPDKEESGEPFQSDE